jgi:hypothetical protein
VDRYDRKEVEKLFRLNHVKGQVNVDNLKRRFGMRHLREWTREGLIVAVGSDIHGTEPGYAPFEKARAFLGERAHVLDQAAARLLSEAKLPG